MNKNLETTIPLISLFSGSGGLDLGFEKQGFKAIVAYDKEPSAVATFNFNRNGIIAKEADLLTYTGQKIIDDISEHSSGLVPRGVIGGPPCQYYSNGNKSPRDDDDPRRLLPVRYAEILKVLTRHYDLDFFLFENVKGLVGPKHKKDFDKLINLFEDAGFYVTAKVLNAYNFGTAQHRERVFIIGWNKSFYNKGSYSFPEGGLSKLTVKDKIDGLVEPQLYERNLVSSEFPVHPNHWTMQPKSPKFNNPLPPHLKKTTRSFRRLLWDDPSYTVAYGHNEIHVHPQGHRRLSIYEAMLLQGFPEGKGKYELRGSLTEQVTLVSDAVPPPLANALAASVKNHFNARTPDESV